MSSSQNYYREKYLKYKNKYLELKMHGGVNCAKIGFRQHEEECWHDSLSMIFCYCDGIGETIQEIFKSEDSFTEFIDTININQDNGVPLELLPPNFDLDNERDKIRLLELSKDYFKQLYKRYANEQKIELDLTPSELKKIQELTREEKDIIDKYIYKNNLLDQYPDERQIFNRFLYNESSYDNTHQYYRWYVNTLLKFLSETKIIKPKPPGLVRQNSEDYSFKCVNYIYEISNHNSSNNLYFFITHRGSVNEEFIPTSIISYFLLNYPIMKQNNQKKLTRTLTRTLSLDSTLDKLEQKSLKFLSFKIYSFETIFIEINTVTNIIDKLQEMKDYIKDAHCMIINTYLGIEGNQDMANRDIINKENIYTFSFNHVQCFFTCDKKLYFYDNQGIKIDGKKKLFVNFNWKDYLNSVIENIIRTITDLNKSKIYNKFSQFYYDSLKYLDNHLALIKNFIIIKNENYTKELFKISLLDNLNFQLLQYNNKNILNIIETNSIDAITLSELLNNVILKNKSLNNNLPAIEKLINKENINDSFTIKTNKGYTPLHFLIVKEYIELINIFLNHPNVKYWFTIQTDEGYTPLHIAILFNKLKSTIALLSHPEIKQCFTIQNINGDTILHTALVKSSPKNIDILNKLLSHPEIKQCFTIKNNKGETPQSIAEQYNIKLTLDL
jgi:ankyrin repeat protein